MGFERSACYCPALVMLCKQLLRLAVIGVLLSWFPFGSAAVNREADRRTEAI